MQSLALQLNRNEWPERDRQAVKQFRALVRHVTGVWWGSSSSSAMCAACQRVTGVWGGRGRGSSNDISAACPLVTSVSVCGERGSSSDMCASSQHVTGGAFAWVSNDDIMFGGELAQQSHM